MGGFSSNPFHSVTPKEWKTLRAPTCPLVHWGGRQPGWDSLKIVVSGNLSSYMIHFLQYMIFPSKSRVEGSKNDRGAKNLRILKKNWKRVVGLERGIPYQLILGLPSSSHRSVVVSFRNCDGLGFPMGVFLFFLCVVTYDSLMAKRRKEYCEGSRKFRKKP